MTTNVLQFPTDRARRQAKPALTQAADVINIGDHEKAPRPLRLATGVFFISHSAFGSDAPTAA